MKAARTDFRVRSRRKEGDTLASSKGGKEGKGGVLLVDGAEVGAGTVVGAFLVHAEGVPCGGTEDGGVEAVEQRSGGGEVAVEQRLGLEQLRPHSTVALARRAEQRSQQGQRKEQVAEGSRTFHSVTLITGGKSNKILPNDKQ